MEKGEPLATALEELRAGGLQLIFSSALISPERRVDVDPGSGSAEDIARRILASHGLTLETIRPGLFAVVRAPSNGPESAVAAATPGPARARPSSASVEPLYEVDVYASRYEIEQQDLAASLAELSRDDLEALPGLDEDVMRVMRFLPGTASNALSARSHVRGGRDDEVAVFFDGVPLFEPFHYKDVQSLLGMLDPESISKLDFFSGVFPARYGNRLSGVLDIKPRTFSGEDYNALGASVLYSHALSQGRLDSHPVEWLLSARRGNVDLFSDLLGRREAEPNFLDGLARVQVDAGPRSTLAAGWLLLDDRLAAHIDEGAEQGHIEYRDATGWASWQFRPNEASELHVTASRTERHTTRLGSVNQEATGRGSVDDWRHFETNTLRIDASARAGSRVTLSGGLEWYDYQAAYQYQSSAQFDPAFAAAFGRPTSFAHTEMLDVGGEAYAAYASALLTVSPRVALDVALRWDAQRFDSAFNDNQFSPRVSLQYQLDPFTALRLSWGRLAQTERPDELQIQDDDATFHPAQRATQTVVSLERRMGSSALVRVEAYDKRITDPTPLYENLLDPFVLLPELSVDRVRVQPDRSRLRGAELSARWQWQDAWSGWTSYSYSEATDHFGAISALRTWDQKHAIATGLSWTNRPWLLSTNVTWHSGWRRNELLNTTNGVVLAPRNSEAWPPYVSLDLRTTWNRAISHGALEVFGEVDNATNHGNPCCSSYAPPEDGSTGPLSRETSTWLPRLFLIGVTWQLP